MNPLWRKLRGDIRSDRLRLMLTVLALALSLAGLSTMLDVTTVLTREIARNYQETTPASATLAMNAVSSELVVHVSALPGVAKAERRRAVSTRAAKIPESRASALPPPEWRPMRLFVIDDFTHLKLNTFSRQEGVWPPPKGTVLVERTASRLMGLKTGDSITVRSPQGPVLPLRVSGMVHDTGLAPSEQERTLYAYATEETLRYLGETGEFDELRLLFSGDPGDRREIADRCRAIVASLKAGGQEVHEVRIPPPHRHPHQGPMEAVLLSFVGFGAMALVLSAVLIATTLSALLTKQAREIAILKAIGASRGQIARIYFALALGIGIVAVLIAVPAGFAAARPFATQISNLINFNIATHAVSHPVLLLQAAIGLALPVLAAAWPVFRAVSQPVRVGLSDHGVQVSTSDPRKTVRPVTRFSAMPRLTLAWRNSLRRRLRFVLTLSLLGTSGAILMSAFNLRNSWKAMIGRVYTERSYDLSVTLRSPEPIDRLAEILGKEPGLRRVESWRSTPVAFHFPGETPVVSVYPDGGHGAFTLYGMPPDSSIVAFPVIAGRWLRPEDTRSVVLNHAARNARPGLAVGDRVSLSVEGRAGEWTVVGVVEEVGSAAAAYVPRSEFPGNEAGTARANLLRIATTSRLPAAKAEALRRVERVLEDAGVRVTLSLPLAELQTAMGQHINVLIVTLVAASLVMGTVAVLGLSTLLSMSVIERTREFGVLRAIGATPGEVSRLVLAEALAVGVLGLVSAIPLSVAVTHLLGRVVGLTAFQIPLPATFSASGLVACALGLLVLIVFAAGFPARSAAQIPLRTALDHG